MKYLIGYSGHGDNGYVGYDGNLTNCVDNCVLFDTEQDAEQEMISLQEEWDARLYIIAYYNGRKNLAKK